MGAFDGLKEAKMFERGVPLSPIKVKNPNYDTGHLEEMTKLKVEPFLYREATYDLRITKCILKETEKLGTAFIAEFEILNSSNPDEHKPGDKRSWFQKMSDKNVAFGAIKAFAAAVLGFDPTNQDVIAKEVAPQIVEVMDKAVGPDNAFKDCKVRVVVSHKKTQRGMDFSVHTWSPLA